MVSTRESLQTLCETIGYYVTATLEDGLFFKSIDKNSNESEKRVIAEKLHKIFYTIRICAEECGERELNYVCARYEKLSLDILHEQVSFDDDIIEMYEDSVYVLLSWKDKLCSNIKSHINDISLVSFFNESTISKVDKNKIAIDANCLLAGKNSTAMKEMLEHSGVTVSKIFVTSNGIDSVKILRDNEIDILFTEISLEGLNGLVLSKKVYDKNKDAIITFIKTDDFLPDFIKHKLVPYFAIIEEPLTENHLTKLFKDIYNILNNPKRDGEVS